MDLLLMYQGMRLTREAIQPRDQIDFKELSFVLCMHRGKMPQSLSTISFSHLEHLDR